MEARAPIHADLPEYQEPSLATKEREIVARLTLLPDSLIDHVDENVRACMPTGSVVTGILPYGQAYWTRTAVIETKQTSGTKLDFFLKVSPTDAGGNNLRGEYASMSVVYGALPGFCPRPIGVGSYASDPNVHFYLQEFVPMTDEIPEPDALAAKMAQLHLTATSPTRKYGFSVPTNQGANTMPNTWTSSWELYFSNLIRRVFEWEQAMHGHHEEMASLFEVLLSKVVPRLLRPLETGGREIIPCIVHGDLWDGNTSIHADDDRPIIFDGSSTYAHNEYELGAWNIPRHQIYRTYIRAYQRHYPISAPAEDVDDRLVLYRLRFDLCSSGCYLANLRFRELSDFPAPRDLQNAERPCAYFHRALRDLRYLTSKYPEGYTGPYPRKSEVEEEMDQGEPQEAVAETDGPDAFSGLLHGQIEAGRVLEMQA